MVYKTNSEHKSTKMYEYIHDTYAHRPENLTIVIHVHKKVHHFLILKFSLVIIQRGQLRFHSNPPKQSYDLTEMNRKSVLYICICMSLKTALFILNVLLFSSFRIVI